jgi:outer membrane protein assembly factor BamB
VGRAGTTRCCSAVALIALSSLAIAAPGRRAANDAPLGLFPLGPVWTLPLNNQITVPPAYAGTHGFFAIEGDRLAAYDLISGRQEWLTSLHPEFEPAVGDGLLFVVEPTQLTALRQTDGTIAWQIPAVDASAVAPVWDNGWLIVSTRSGAILAYGARDGHLVWRHELGSAARARPSLAADRVYVAGDDSRIVALRVDTGEPVWERLLGGPATALLALDDRVYASSTDNFFYSIDAVDGRVGWRWRTGADVVGVPVVDDRNVYFVSFDNVVRALLRRNGVQQWVRLLPFRPIRGPLMIARTIVVSGIAPVVRAFNAKDGTPAGSLTGAGDLASAPYEVPNPTGLPQLLLVTHDLAKGATATLLRRHIEPDLSAFVPPPSAAVKLTPSPAAAAPP